MSFRENVTNKPGLDVDVASLSDLELDPDREAFPLTAVAAAVAAVVGGVVAATALPVALDPDGT